MKNSELLLKSFCEKGVLHLVLFHESQYLLHFDDTKQIKLKKSLINK
jgi:hypothetical protein